MKEKFLFRAGKPAEGTQQETLLVLQTEEIGNHLQEPRGETELKRPCIPVEL